MVAGGIALLEGEYTLQTVVADADPDDQRAVAMLPGGGFVILDCAVTPELAAEGLARDVVRAVQQARRDAGLEVSDRIALTLGGDDVVRAAVETHAELITAETLAGSLETLGPLGERLGVRRRRPGESASLSLGFAADPGDPAALVAFPAQGRNATRVTSHWTLTSLSVSARFGVSSMTPELCGSSGVDPRVDGNRKPWPL